MATYFIDPYKKYYDALNGKTDLPAQAEALAAKAGEAASSISSILLLFLHRTGKKKVHLS